MRRASPFLLALLEAERMTLESVLMQVGPIRDWPEGPSLYRAVTQWRTGERAVEQAVASLAFDGPQVLMEFLPEAQFRLADGGWMRVCVVGHSVEVEAKVGATDYQSQFGELTVRARSYLPEALAAACVGRLLDEVALHPLTAGRGWRVKAAHVFALGTTVTVETGSVPFRLFAEVIP